MKTGIGLAEEIKEYLEEEKFENEEELVDYIYDRIDDALIYSSDIFEYAEYYLDSQALCMKFFDQLADDVFRNIKLRDYLNGE